MRTTLFYLLATVLLTSCKFNPNIQGSGSDALQGLWEEDQVLYQDSLSQYTSHKIRFSCDSFYLTLKTVARAEIYPDTCYRKGSWTEFVKGTYTTTGDTLYLNGTFTKSDFKQKISGCFRMGTYKPIFVIVKRSGQQMKLQNLMTHFPVLLNLKQKTTCIPKPL